MKIIIVLLLGIAISVVPAYAQSNTERLTNIDDNVVSMMDSISDVLEMIQQISGLNSTINGIGHQVDRVSDQVTETQLQIIETRSSVDDVNGAVNAVSEQLANLDGLQNSVTGLTSNVNRISTSVSTIESAISNFDNLAATITANNISLGSIEDRLTDIESTLISIQASMGSDDNNNDDVVSSLDFLSNSVNRLNSDINTKLSGVEDRLTALESKLEQPSQTSPSLPTTLSKNTLRQDITAYTYNNAGTRSGNTYTLEMTFSCDKVVNLDQIRTVGVGQTVLPPNPTGITPENYLRVDNQDLYNSKFEVSSGSYTTLNRGSSFNLQSLPAGTPLTFVSQQDDTGRAVSESTRDSSGFRYSIVVEYLGSRDTTCVLNTGLGSSSTLSDSDSLLLSANISSDTGILSTFSNTLDCNDDPVEITDIDVQAVGTWNTALTGFAEMRLTVLDGDRDNSPDVTIDLGDDGVLRDVSYPISFNNANLRIDGTIPPINGMLIVIDYNTVDGGSCTDTSQ